MSPVCTDFNIFINKALTLKAIFERNIKKTADLLPVRLEVEMRPTTQKPYNEWLAAYKTTVFEQLA